MRARDTASPILRRQNTEIVGIFDQLGGEFVGRLRVGLSDEVNNALKILNRAVNDGKHVGPGPL